MSVELRHLRSFVAVAEESHIGRAARRLFITQPALSRQMQQLEREVGVKLLRRTARGIELTDEGREMLRRARVAVHAADEALAVGRDAGPSGPLSLGVSIGGPPSRWHDLTNDFVAQFPRVELDVRTALSEPLQRELVAGRLDAAIALAPARLPGLRYAHLLDEPVFAWVDRDHPLAARGPIALADLEGAVIRIAASDPGRPVGFNDAIRALLAGAGVATTFSEIRGAHPARAHRDATSVSLAPALDFPDSVVAVPIEPVATMPYVLVRRDGEPHAGVEALTPFAREWLARASCAQDMAPA